MNSTHRKSLIHKTAILRNAQKLRGNNNVMKFLRRQDWVMAIDAYCEKEKINPLELISIHKIATDLSFDSKPRYTQKAKKGKHKS